MTAVRVMKLCVVLGTLMNRQTFATFTANRALFTAVFDESFPPEMKPNVNFVYADIANYEEVIARCSASDLTDAVGEGLPMDERRVDWCDRLSTW